MVRIRASSFLVAVAGLALATSAWAAHLDTTTFTATQPTTFGTKTLDPGDYELRAQESGNQLEVLRDGKVVAQVPVRWVTLPQKSSDSEVTTNNNVVQQVQFSGRTEAVQLQSSSEQGQ